MINTVDLCLIQYNMLHEYIISQYSFHYCTAVILPLSLTVCHFLAVTCSRVFPQLPDLTFLSFLYKIDITGFQNQQKIIASTGYWTYNTNPTIRIPAPLPTQPICQSMPASNFQTLLKSCSIKPEMIKVQFMNLLFNRCLGGWVVKGAGNLRVGLVLWVQYPVEAIFFCWFWNPVMSILYKNDRNVRSGNWGKTRLNAL